MNLVVVSNRVSRGKANEPMTGGLAAALLPVVEKSGAIWVGSSGRVRDGAQKVPFAEIEALGAGALAMLDLPAAHYGGYYEGFANSALWPALHSRTDLIRASQADYLSYREVNAFMARALLRFQKPDTAFWIQDYHFLALGAELRDLGVAAPLGFFLHTPWPVRQLLVTLPHHRRLVESLFAYDLIGFQTQEWLDLFRDYVISEARGELAGYGGLEAFDRKVRIGVFPIGIDVQGFIDARNSREGARTYDRMAASAAFRSMMVGVDRLDYSKGLEERMVGYEQFLHDNADMRGDVFLVQVTPISRDDVDTYQDIRARLDALAGRINGEYADMDWQPIRYLNRSYRRDQLAGIYRAARVCLVTPLRDGMNLVAKEYVAAQNPDDPGVLILSRFAGAAEQMGEALLVNPFSREEVADAIKKALTMPLAERVRKWKALMQVVRDTDVGIWRDSFVGALNAVEIVGDGAASFHQERADAA